MVPEWHVGPVAVPVHGLFVGLGVLTAMIVFVVEARRRGAVNDQSLVAVAGALVGGAIGMRLSGWARHLDFGANPTVAQAWQFGSKSILGGLLGAYVGVLIAKRIGGYRGKTGDLFAPAVALGHGRRPDRVLSDRSARPADALPWGVHAPASTPECPGCLTGQAMHPVVPLRDRLPAGGIRGTDVAAPPNHPAWRTVRPLCRGLCGVPVLRRVHRANETVWLDLTRPQWFLLPSLVLIGFRLSYGYRHGYYRTPPRGQEVLA